MWGNLYPLAFALGLAAAMVASIWLGRRLAKQIHGDAEGSGISAIDGALYGLFGLVLAFTFAGAAARFEDRRDLIREEANAIGTAYLRLDLLPAEHQPELRAAFKHYVEARVASYRDLSDVAGTKAANAEAVRLQGEIWTKSVAGAARANGPQATTLLLPALNEMIDITTTRAVAMENHPPTIIYIMLVVLACATSLNAGYAMGTSGRSSPLHTCAFVAAISLTVYVVVDLEYPRLGLFTIASADHVIAEVGAQMKP